MVIIMAKDKIIGFIVMILGIFIAIVYTMGSVIDLWFSTWGGDDLWAHHIFGEFIGSILSWELFVVLPLWLIVILISIIAIWIGYSMLTTPAPVPLEELEEELAAEEEAEETS
jgi:predicted membrane protein